MKKTPPPFRMININSESIPILAVDKDGDEGERNVFCTFQTFTLWLANT